MYKIILQNMKDCLRKETMDKDIKTTDALNIYFRTAIKILR